jgi:NADH:ubiquinone reductase (H+-translocating)
VSAEARTEPHVVIVGGGFGGLHAAKSLRRSPVRVTLVDRRNYHLFQPLLYEVATAGLSSADIASPIRQILRKQANATVLLGDVVDIELEHRRVVLVDGLLHYDYLVLAAGAELTWFGHDEWARHAAGLKCLDDALAIRRRILSAFEAAEREPDDGRRRRLLTFVIVGGGPTGVELAGAISEIATRTMARDFRNFDPKEARIVLLEAADILPGMPASLVAEAKRQLERRGVEVRTRSPVTGVDEYGVEFNGSRIDTPTVLWAAGVKPSSLVQRLGVETVKGRIVVHEDLSVPGRPEVFVVGDLLGLEQGGRLLPGVAPVAIQSGKHVAANITRRVEGAATKPFHYHDKGTIASVGRASAVARLPHVKLRGTIAWLLGWVVHIFWLIGFQNRMSVFIGWIWSYLSWRRTARVILPPAVARGGLPSAESATRQLEAPQGEALRPHAAGS